MSEDCHISGLGSDAPIKNKSGGPTTVTPSSRLAEDLVSHSRWLSKEGGGGQRRADLEGRCINAADSSAFNSRDLRFSRFHNCYLYDATFYATDFTDSLFSDCTFINCKFLKSSLDTSLFTRCDFQHCDFAESVFDGAEFVDCHRHGGRTVQCTFLNATRNGAQMPATDWK